MALIDELLARTHLRDNPVRPRDVVAYRDSAQATPPSRDALWDLAVGGGHDHDAAALDLTTLCESVLAHTGIDSLQEEFDTEHLPVPGGARVLGCILHLADDADSARMWWQYAAGADDDIAAFCLYLHHQSLGESDVAERWRAWTRIDTQPAPERLTPTSPPPPVKTVDVSTLTVLRILGRLISRERRPRSEFATAVMDYVPTAVAASYIDNPDVEMPVPNRHFAEEIGAILAVTTALDQRRPATQMCRGHHRTPKPLPDRPAYESPRPDPTRPDPR